MWRLLVVRGGGGAVDRVLPGACRLEAWETAGWKRWKPALRNWEDLSDFGTTESDRLRETTKERID